jgi:hypothetical protein
MTKSKITLNCWIIDTDVTNERFTVHIQTSKTVHNLKEIIMEKRPSAFQGEDAAKLSLYKVSLPRKTLNEQLQGLNSPKDIGEFMDPMSRLSNCFKSPAEMHLHVIIKPDGER